MTPDQIFKAENKLRELKKVRDSLENFGDYVFGADVGQSSGKPPFPMGNSDASKLLRDAALTWLNRRAELLEQEVREIGVILP